MFYLFYSFLIFVTVGFGFTVQKRLKQRRLLWLVYGVSAFIMMVFLFRVTRCNLFSDFRIAYYPASHLIRQNPADLYMVATGVSAAGFVNIPIFALLFVPFSLLPEYPAGCAFTVLGLLTTFATCYVLIKMTKVSGWRRIVLVGMFASNGPLLYSLKEGKITDFLLPLLLAAFFCLANKHEVWLGVLLAIATLTKPPLLLLGAYFLLRKRWKALGVMIGTLLIVTSTSLLLFGVELHRVWFQNCILPFIGKPIAAFNVQSLDSFLVRLWLNNEDLITHLSKPVAWLPMEVDLKYKLLRFTLLSLLVGGTIWSCWCSRAPATSEVENLEFSIFRCLILLISPISWSHYYLLLLLPFSLYLGEKLAVPSKSPWLGWVMLTVLLTSLPVIFVDHVSPALKPLVYKLLISHYFFGGILLLVIFLAARCSASLSLSQRGLSSRSGRFY